jgi:nucleotide-binding universal stress UspA family protein
VDVIGWLKRHGIVAESLTSASTGDNASRLCEIAERLAADFIVAGAFRHSRIREWMLGDVTHNLLLRAKLCSFVSH